MRLYSLINSGRPAAALAPRIAVWLAVGLAAWVEAGCADPNQEPVTASSVDSPAYAVQHPAEMEYLNQRVVAERQSAEQGFGKFREFPPPLGEPDWEAVGDLYEAADEEGSASAYAEAQREAAVVQRFFTEEQTELVGRISSTVQYAAKEKRCEDVQFGGPAQRGLERGIDKQLELRRRRTSQVQHQIDAREKTLGPKVAERLRDQVDQISFASYTVHVALAADELHLRQLLDNSNSVKDTLEEEKKRLDDPKNSDPKRRRAVEEALKKLDVETVKAREQLTETEQRDHKLVDDYQAALDALLADVHARAEKASQK